MKELVRIKQDIVDAACGDHPELLLLRKGQIVERVCPEGRVAFPVYVRDENGRQFGLNSDEIEPVQTAIVPDTSGGPCVKP